jgi:putative ABC transport system permease protein
VTFATYTTDSVCRHRFDSVSGRSLRGDVLEKLIAGSALKLAGVGLVFGVPVSLALGRVMSGALHGLVALNPLIVAGFTAVLAASALLASYVPARKASQVDPLVALRSD